VTAKPYRLHRDAFDAEANAVANSSRRSRWTGRAVLD